MSTADTALATTATVVIETRRRGTDGWVIETPALDADWDRARDLLRARDIRFINENWMFGIGAGRDRRWFTPAELVACLEG